MGKRCSSGNGYCQWAKSTEYTVSEEDDIGVFFFFFAFFKSTACFTIKWQSIRGITFLCPGVPDPWLIACWQTAPWTAGVALLLWRVTRQTPGVPLQDYPGHHSLWLIKDGWFSKPLTLIPTAQMECRNPPYRLKTTLLFMWEYVKADP